MKLKDIIDVLICPVSGEELEIHDLTASSEHSLLKSNLQAIPRINRKSVADRYRGLFPSRFFAMDGIISTVGTGHDQETVFWCHSDTTITWIPLRNWKSAINVIDMV